MPKMFIHSSPGIFVGDARARLAAALTDLGLACEKLADTPAVRQGIWIIFADHTPEAMFSGGALSSELVALIVYALEGGLDKATKRKLVADATTILEEHASRTADTLTVYVVIREVPETNWGMRGKTVKLAALRESS